jgi:hypothetical protein
MTAPDAESVLKLRDAQQLVRMIGLVEQGPSKVLFAAESSFIDVNICGREG